MNRFYAGISLFLGYVGYMVLCGAFFLCAEYFFPAIFFFPLLYVVTSFLYGWFMTRYTAGPFHTVMLNFASYLLYWVTVFLIAVLKDGEYGGAVVFDAVFGLEVLVITLVSSRFYLAWKNKQEENE